MGLFDRLIRHNTNIVDDNDIVAIADGEIVDIKTVNDPIFSQEMLGKSLAFHFPEKKIKICSPANGKIEVLFPTGHAFGIKMKNGTELMVHIGIDTVDQHGKGFKYLKKKVGDDINAGEAVVEVDFQQLSQMCDMSTMLIVTKNSGNPIHFKEPGKISLMESVLIEDKDMQDSDELK